MDATFFAMFQEKRVGLLFLVVIPNVILVKSTAAVNFFFVPIQ